MARKTRLTIFDEPEAGIDLWSFQNLIGVFQKLRRETSGSLVIISHQERILEIADELVVLAERRRHGARPAGGDPPRPAQGRREPLRLLPAGRRESAMNKITEMLLETGLRAIRRAAQRRLQHPRGRRLRRARQSTDNVRITSKTDEAGHRHQGAARHEGRNRLHPRLRHPHGGCDDLVYNDFYIGDGADVTIVAGCGVHNEGEEESQHNGIHRFFIGKDARVLYLEKHVGVGEGTRQADHQPADLGPHRRGRLHGDGHHPDQGGRLDQTDHPRRAHEGRPAGHPREAHDPRGADRRDRFLRSTSTGEDSGCDLVSRSVARGSSHQVFRSVINGNTRCTGHSDCDAIIMDDGVGQRDPRADRGQRRRRPHP